MSQCRMCFNFQFHVIYPAYSVAYDARENDVEGGAGAASPGRRPRRFLRDPGNTFIGSAFAAHPLEVAVDVATDNRAHIVAARTMENAGIIPGEVLLVTGVRDPLHGSLYPHHPGGAHFLVACSVALVSTTKTTRTTLAVRVIMPSSPR